MGSHPFGLGHKKNRSTPSLPEVAHICIPPVLQLQAPNVAFLLFWWRRGFKASLVAETGFDERVVTPVCNHIILCSFKRPSLLLTGGGGGSALCRRNRKHISTSSSCTLSWTLLSPQVFFLCAQMHHLAPYSLFKEVLQMPPSNYYY